MIERYSRKEIKKIWEEKNKYKIWLDIEIAAAQAMEKIKVIPRGVAKKVQKKAIININRIHKIEKKVHHDVFPIRSNEQIKHSSKLEHGCSLECKSTPTNTTHKLY